MEVKDLNYSEIAPRLIDSTRKELKRQSLSKDERMLVVGQTLSLVSHVAGVNEATENLGKKTVRPLFLNKDETPNLLGRSLSKSELNAVLSFSSSVGGLVCNTLAVTGGVHMYKKHPNWGMLLVGYGLANHAVSSIKPIETAMLSTSGIAKAAEKGNDFAATAMELHNVTGISVKTIAATTAVAWTVLIPAILLTWFVANKAQESNTISDFTAFREWLIQAQSHPEEFNKLKNKYEGKLETEEDIDRFTLFLIENVPAKQLKAIKEEIVANYKSARPVSLKEKVISRLSLAGSLGWMAVSIGYIAAKIFTKATPLLLKILNCSTPIFATLSLVSDTYTTMQELKNKNLPKQVKMLSVAKLICTIVGTGIFVAAVFIPGINLIAIGVYALTVIASLALSCAKNHYLQRHIEIQQAIEPENFDFMIKWSKEREGQTNAAQYTGLTRWQKRVEEAREKNLLAPDQVRKLDSLQKRPTFLKELMQRIHLPCQNGNGHGSPRVELDRPNRIGRADKQNVVVLGAKG